MNKLQQGADIIVGYCLDIRQKEKVLIIVDEEMEDIGDLLADAAKNKSNNVEIIEIPIAEVNGEEPDDLVAEKMKKQDVIMIATVKSMTHTDAVRNACKAGARAASMPGINKGMIERLGGLDNEEMRRKIAKMTEEFSKGENVKIVADGTDITLRIGKIKHRETEGKIKKGECGNIPYGEFYFCPLEGSANGIYVVDLTLGGVGSVDSPIKITVKDGFAVKIDGGRSAEELKKALESVNDKNAYNIAELGIGVNDAAKITGKTLEDEKVYGTCHIALGDNKSLGGKVSVGCHIDGVFNKPTIYVDDKVVMEDGRIVIR